MTQTNRKTRWWKTALKALAFLILVLVTLAILAAALLSHLGRREWAQTKADLVARGEKLSLAEFQMPSLPDAQNFFGDPMWQELTELVDAEIEEDGVRIMTKQIRLPEGRRQLDALKRPLTPEERRSLAQQFPGIAVPDDATVAGLVRTAFKSGEKHPEAERKRNAAFLLAVLRGIEPTLTRLEELAGRPGARFSLEAAAENIAASISQTNYLMQYAQILQARIWAELTLGESAAAHRDTLTLLRLPETLRDSPLWIYFLVRVSLETIALDSLRDGLEARVWSERELAEIELILARTDLPTAFALALRGERAFGNQLMEEMHQMPNHPSPAMQAWSTPAARAYLAIFGAGDQAARNRLFQTVIEILDHTSALELNARTFSVYSGELTDLKKSFWRRFRYPTTALIMPELSNPVGRCFRAQETAAQARVVCALERYRLKNGVYPADLKALVPDFLPSSPLDLATLDPMRYRQDGETFRLWSPGWNGVEDQGGGDDLVWGKEGDGR